jgi:hypothetical protein
VQRVGMLAVWVEELDPVVQHAAGAYSHPEITKLALVC